MKLDSTNISQVVVVTHREPIVPGEWRRDPNNPSPSPAIARSYRNSLITNETDLFGWTQEWQNCDKRQIGWGLLCTDILTLIVILLKLIPDLTPKFHYSSQYVFVPKLLISRFQNPVSLSPEKKKQYQISSSVLCSFHLINFYYPSWHNTPFPHGQYWPFG